MALLNVNDELAKKELKTILDKGQELETIDLAIRYAYKLKLNAYKPIIRTHLNSTNKNVKLAAIHFLGRWKDKDSKTFFTECLKSDDLQIRQAGELSLKLLKKK